MSTTIERDTKISKKDSKPPIFKSPNLPLYISAFLIPVIIALIGLALGGFAPFGTKDVLTAGGFSDLIPYYSEFIARAKAGTLMEYSIQQGSGYDFTTVITWYLSDPTNLLLLIFPETAMLSVLDILYALKLGAAGLCFAIFLTKRREYMPMVEPGELYMQPAPVKSSKKNNKKAAAAENFDATLASTSSGSASDSSKVSVSEKSPDKSQKSDIVLGLGLSNSAFYELLKSFDIRVLAFSLCYALSNFMLSYGMDMTRCSAIAIFPLLMLGIERLVYQRRYTLYVITFAVSIYLSFHTAIISSIFILLYFFTRDYKSFPYFLDALKYKFASDIAAVAISMLVILNNLTSIFADENINMSFLHSGCITSPLDIIKMLFSGTTPSGTIENSMGIDIFCGTMVLLLVLSLIFNRGTNTRRKYADLAIILILFFANYSRQLGHFLNGFLYTNSNVSYFNYVLIFMLLITAYTSLYAVHLNSSGSLVLCFSALVVLIISTSIFCVFYDSFTPFMKSIEYLLAYFLLIIVWKNRSMTNLVFNYLFSIVIILEMIASAVTGFRTVAETAISYTDTDTYKFYTVENYIHESEPDARILVYESYYTNSTPLTNMLLGYDYVIADESASHVDSELELIETMNGVAIYKNPYTLDGTVYVPSSITDVVSSDSYPFTSQNLLVTDVFESDAIFDIVSGDMSISEGFSLSADERADRYTINRNYILNYTIDESGDLYTNLSHIIHLGDTNVSDGASIFYTVCTDDIMLGLLGGEYALYNHDAFVKLYEKLKSSSYSDYILLNATSPLNWSINGNSGISLSLAGNDVTLISTGSGDDTIYYTPVYFNAGLIISILTLICFIVLCRVKLPKVSLSKASDFLNDNRVYVYTIFASLIMYFIVAVMKSCFPFGNGTMVISDGYGQTYLNHMYMYSQLKSGSIPDIVYNHGFASLSYFTSRLINPLNYVMMIVPSSVSLIFYNILYLIRFLLVGPSMLLYLTHRRCGRTMDKHSLKLVAIALCYVLNTFVISYFNFNDYLTFIIMVPVLSLMLERLVYDRKHLPYILILAWYIMYESYTAFILCEYLALYFLIIKHDTIKSFFKNLVRFAAASVLSAGIMAGYIVSYYAYLRTSTYSSTDSSDSMLDMLTAGGNTLLDSIKDLELLHETTYVSVDWTTANAYAGILTLLVLVLFTLNSKVPASIRIKKTILIILYYFAFGNKFLNYVLHGFHNQSMVPNRFAIFFIFLLITALYDCVIDFHSCFNKRSLTALSLWSVLIISLMLYKTLDTTPTACIVSVALIIIYYGMYLIGYIRKNYYTMTRIALVILVMELAVGFINDAYISTGSQVSTMDESNIKIINKISDEYNLGNHYDRTEFVDTDMLNFGLLCSYSSVSSFAALSGKQEALCDYWCVYNNKNNIMYIVGNPLAAMMFNVRYLLTDNFFTSTTIPNYINEVKSYGNINLLENPYAAGFGILTNLDGNINRDDYGNSFEYQNAISQALVGEDLYTEIVLETDESKITDKTSYMLAQIEDGTDETNENISTVNARIYVAPEITGDLYITYRGYIYYLGYKEITEDSELYEYSFEIDVTEETYDSTVHIGVVSADVEEALYSKLTECTMEDITVDDTVITGTIDADTTGTLFISLPNYDGWTAYVDGQKVEILDYLGGIGIEISETGTHDIKLVYEKSGVAVGMIISIISVLILAGYIVYTYKKKSVNTKDADEPEVSDVSEAAVTDETAN